MSVTAHFRALERQSEDEREQYKLRRTEIREKVYKLKLRGKTMPEIEQALVAEGITDISMGMCAVLLKEHLKFLAAHDPETKEARKLEADRYESLIAVLWDRSQSGDLDAINVLSALIKSKSRLLGLEAAAKLSVKITPVMPTYATQEELEEKQRDLFNRMQATGRIPGSLTFDEWRYNPRMYSAVAETVRLSEEVTRSHPKDFIEGQYTSETE